MLRLPRRSPRRLASNGGKQAAGASPSKSPACRRVVRNGDPTHFPAPRPPRAEPRDRLHAMTVPASSPSRRSPLAKWPIGAQWALLLAPLRALHARLVGGAPARRAAARAYGRGDLRRGDRRRGARAASAVPSRAGGHRLHDRRQAAALARRRGAAQLADFHRRRPLGHRRREPARLVAGALARAARRHRRLGLLARRGDRDDADVGKLRRRHAAGGA